MQLDAMSVLSGLLNLLMPRLQTQMLEFKIWGLYLVVDTFTFFGLGPLGAWLSRDGTLEEMSAEFVVLVYFHQLP